MQHAAHEPEKSNSNQFLESFQSFWSQQECAPVGPDVLAVVVERVLRKVREQGVHASLDALLPHQLLCQALRDALAHERAEAHSNR